MNVYPCIVPKLRKKEFGFSPLSVMLAVGFLEMFFMKLIKFPSIPSVLRVYFLITIWCWKLSGVSPALSDMIIYFIL